MMRWYLIGVAIGVGSEASAHLQRLWVYRRPLYPVVNVLLVFGAVMGTLASLVAHLGAVPVFAIATAFGLAYEVVNLRWLDWWYFPGERLYWLRGHNAVVVAISLIWGVIPLLVFLIDRLVAPSP